MASSLHRFVLAAASLLVAFAFPSCAVYWNIGDNIMQSCVTHIGLDIYNPVGGVIYRQGEGVDAVYYLEAPEYTYKEQRKTVAALDFMAWKHTDPFARHRCNMEPSGKARWLKVCLHEGSWSKLELVECDGPPAGATQLPAIRKEDAELLPFGADYSGFYVPACIVGIPIRYVVDPALSIVSTVAWYAIGAPSFSR